MPKKYKSKGKQHEKLSKDGLTRVDKVSGKTENVSQQEAATKISKHSSSIKMGRARAAGPGETKRRVRFKRPPPPPGKAGSNATQKGSSGALQKYGGLEQYKRYRFVDRITLDELRRFQPESPWKWSFKQYAKTKAKRFIGRTIKRVVITGKILDRSGRVLHRITYNKVREAEDENSAVKAANETGHTVESSSRRLVQEFRKTYRSTKKDIEKLRKQNQFRKIYKDAKAEAQARAAPDIGGAHEHTAAPPGGPQDNQTTALVPVEHSGPLVPSGKVSSQPSDLRRNYRWVERGTGKASGSSRIHVDEQIRTRRVSASNNPRIKIDGKPKGSAAAGAADQAKKAQKAASTKTIKKIQHNRRIQEAAKEAAQKIGEEAVRMTVAAVKKAVAFVRNNLSVIGIMVALLMVAGFFTAGISSCAGMVSSITGTVLSSYLAEPKDIHDTELFATKLEAELDKKIKDLPSAPEWSYIDEFRYDLDPIGHNPFVLMGYLTMKYQDFTFAEIQHVIQELHDARYDLQLDVETETREDDDGDSYTYYILNVTLRSKTIEEVIQPEMDADTTGEMQEWYNVLMETKGNHQAYKNPFDYDWTDSIKSSYGYRVDPIGGVNLQIHRGLDLPCPIGTPIRAAVTGTVIQTGYDDIYGNFIVLEDEKYNHVVKYAHCDRLLLTSGAPVVAGETIIAESGNTGGSTGPHLHIEIKEDGEYMNPTYLVEWELPKENNS